MNSVRSQLRYKVWVNTDNLIDHIIYELVSHVVWRDIDHKLYTQIYNKICIPTIDDVESTVI